MRKRFVFAIQGEGRGHLTQAIAVAELLRKHGHEVKAVIVGKSSRRCLPEFFTKKINAPIISLPSPNFITDKHNRSINLPKTILKNIAKTGSFRKSLREMKRAVEIHQPDAIINFYEPLAGIFGLFYGHRYKVISIAHQYVYLHPEFEFPGKHMADRLALKFYTKLTSWGSELILALSNYQLTQPDNPKLRVIPPILRNELFNQQVHHGDFILVYLVNSGYMQDIIEWHKQHPDTKIHCFTDSREVKTELRYSEHLTFHSLDDKKFLQMMSRCKGLVCTAGFESVCEAMYLEKPVMMIPVKGHFEQFCNSRDAFKAGAGIYDDHFNISRFIQYLPVLTTPKDHFKEWVNSMEIKLMQGIYKAFDNSAQAEHGGILINHY